MFRHDPPNVGHLRLKLAASQLGVARVQVRQMICAQVNVIIGKPRRPEVALEPGVRRHPGSRILARDIEVDDTEASVDRQKLLRVVERRKPARGSTTRFANSVE